MSVGVGTSGIGYRGFFSSFKRFRGYWDKSFMKIIDEKGRLSYFICQSEAGLKWTSLWTTSRIHVSAISREGGESYLLAEGGLLAEKISKLMPSSLFCSSWPMPHFHLYWTSCNGTIHSLRRWYGLFSIYPGFLSSHIKSARMSVVAYVVASRCWSCGCNW